jgi:molecular chaperone HtpG
MVDQWAVEGLTEFDGKPLFNAMEADLDMEEGEKGDDGGKKKEGKTTEEKPDPSGEFASFIECCRKVLSEQVSEVRLSERLTDSPACLVIPKGGLPAHIERVLRATQKSIPETRRILEINPGHTLINRLREIHAADAESPRLTELIELIYDQALLAEGSPIADPVRFARRMTDLLQAAADAKE